MSESSTKPEPLVTICIPVYNGEKTLERTLISIIGQTYRNLEIVVIDNKSDDSTVGIAKKFKDPRIRIIEHDVHLDSAEKNWNTCFEYANGEYMAIFHADDTYHPAMVENEVSCFKKNPSIGAVFTSAVFIDENDNPLGIHSLPSKIENSQVLDFKEAFSLILENWNFFLTPSAMVKTRLYKELSPFCFEQFRSSSDLDMWLRILEHGPVGILDEKLLNYRVTTTSGSYKINTLRTGKADFFLVTEFYLTKYRAEPLRDKTLRRYYCLELQDMLERAKNHIRLGEQVKAVEIIDVFFSRKYLKSLLYPDKYPEYQKIWLSGLAYRLILKLFPELAKKLVERP